MAGTKTNERPGTRAKASHVRSSAYKAREVLDLIRGKSCAEAQDILAFCERDAARPIGKVLDSAMANAEHNEGLDGDELYVAACYADEGPTLKRWRPRARGRATRIRKRTCHITVIVSRYDPDTLERMRARLSRRNVAAAETRRRRVARSRAAAAPDESASDDPEGAGTGAASDDPEGAGTGAASDDPEGAGTGADMDAQAAAVVQATESAPADSSEESGEGAAPADSSEESGEGAAPADSSEESGEGAAPADSSEESGGAEAGGADESEKADGSV